MACKHQHCENEQLCPHHDLYKYISNVLDREFSMWEVLCFWGKLLRGAHRVSIDKDSHAGVGADDRASHKGVFLAEAKVGVSEDVEVGGVGLQV